MIWFPFFCMHLGISIFLASKFTEELGWAWFFCAPVAFFWFIIAASQP